MTQANKIRFVFVNFNKIINTGANLKEAVLNHNVLKSLLEIKQNGKSIVLSTDGDDHDARRYKEKLADHGYKNFFDDTITISTFGYSKRSPHYWPAVQNLLKFEKDEALVLDGTHEILENARSMGITAIDTTAPDALNQLSLHLTT